MHDVRAVSCGIFFGISLFSGVLLAELSDKDAFIQTMHGRVVETIQHARQVPGCTSEEYSRIQTGLEEYWKTLLDKGVIEVTATDQEARPYFVALQGMIEHVLADELGKSVRKLIGVIHTPMPATPLCTEESLSDDLVHVSIACDPLRLWTVKARTTILREYLLRGGDLYVVYPREGRLGRTQVQQHIYQKLLETYPTHLFDRPLDCQSLEKDLIGAFYLFENSEGKRFAFAIKMTQANHPQNLGSFGLWFGEVSESSPVTDRITHVMRSILQDHSQPISLL